MSAAARPILPLLALALFACSEPAEETAANNAAPADIEALPADESAATPTDELANGATEPSNTENSGY
jgi:hypothetical protein